MRKPLQLATSNDGDQNELTTTKPRQRAHFRFVAHGELTSNYFAWTIGINWTIYVGLYTAIRHLMAVEWMLYIIIIIITPTTRRTSIKVD